jgi:hypothetical protein
MIKDEDIQSKLKEIDEHIRKEYIERQPKKERDCRTYEQRFSLRIKEAMKALDPLVQEAASTIRIEKEGAGRPDSLTLEQKVKLLLIKQLVGESNRMYANMLGRLLDGLRNRCLLQDDRAAVLGRGGGNGPSTTCTSSS